MKIVNNMKHNVIIKNKRTLANSRENMKVDGYLGAFGVLSCGAGLTGKSLSNDKTSGYFSR